MPGHGEVIDAPIDAQHSAVDVVQPDLIVVLKNNRIIAPTRVRGAPDLVVEIVSPSTQMHDRQLKFRLY